MMTPSDSPGDNSPGGRSQAIEEGRRHHHAGRLDEARAIYERVLAEAPENAPEKADVLHMLGVVALQQGRLDNALERIEKALALKPDFALAHNSAGSVHQRLGRTDDAIGSFRAAVEADPEYGNAHFNLGTMLLVRHQHNEAARALARAAELRPDFADAHLKLGVAYKSLGRHGQAIEALERAAELKPDFADAYSSLGNVHAAIGELEKAEAAYGKAVDTDPGSHAAHFNLGNVLGRLGKREQAIASYERALEIEPGFADAQGNLAEALFDAGERERAFGVFRQAIDDHPAEAVLHWMFASALLKAGDLDAALETVDAGLDAAPGSTRNLSLKAAVLTARGEGKAARALVDFDRFIEAARIERVPGFDSVQAFNVAFRDHIESHPTLFGDPTHHATRHGKHTGELLQEPKGPVAALEQIIIEKGEAYRRKMTAGPAHPFLAAPPLRFSLTVWAVVLPAGGYQTAHIHPDAWLSGVYYAQVPESITKEDESHAGWIAFAETAAMLDGEPGTLQEKGARLIRPEEGLMVLFPSYFYHGTIPFETDETRISVAFDLMPA
ncbi:MAG: tetratricopeptide repeat protein [Proteobacteria bacterium]|nr:tetratricopeptide repeat protein [Pseudomonadota bacterium]